MYESVGMKLLDASGQAIEAVVVLTNSSTNATAFGGWRHDESVLWRTRNSKSPDCTPPPTRIRYVTPGKPHHVAA